MTKRVLIGTALVAVLIFAGCGSTSVQKGTAVGAGVGAGSGALVGHYLTSLGGATGAAIGLGVGAATGALAADAYYGAEEEELAGYETEVNELNTKLEDSHAQVAKLSGELEAEAAQRQALLEAHEKLRAQLAKVQSPGAAEAGLEAGEDIEVSKEPGGGIKITIISEVLFDSGKAELTSKGKAILAEAADIIKRQFPESSIEVRGHTDNVPIRYSKHESNMELSCKRAISVYNYFIKEQNFSPDRFNVAGYGDTMPIASNDTPEGRRRNRRAEIIIKPKALNVAERKAE